MIAKKDKRVDLERRKGAFLLFGFMVPGTLLLAAFTYRKPILHLNEKVKTSSTVVDFYEEVPVVEKLEEQKVEPEVQQTEQEEQTIDIMNEIDENIKTKKNTGDLIDPNKVTMEGVKYKFSDEFKFVDEDVDVIPEIVEIPDVDAQYVGGLVERQKRVNSEFQFPTNEFDLEAGTIYVQFVVETDGSITSVEILRGINARLDREAKRVVSEFPKWIPGEYKGKKVRTRVRMPIEIQLD